MPLDKTKTGLSRRDFIKIVAVGGIAGLTAKFSLDATSQKEIVSETRLLMGTVVNLTVIANSVRMGREAISACLNRMAELEQVLSRHRTDSQLSLLNQQGTLDQADQSLLDVLALSRQVSQWSDGAFDVTIKPLGDLYTRENSAGRGIPDEREIAEAQALVDYRQLTVDGGRISFGQPGMAVTLDGVAKGHIIDAGVGALQERGFTNVLVEAGGDLSAAGGGRSGDGWNIGLKSPRELSPSLLGRLSVWDQAVATSGDYLQSYTPDFSSHHVIDPRTGYSGSELASVTVVAPSAALADALATAVLVMGVEKGTALVRRIPDCDATLVTKNLEILHVGGMTLST